MNAFVQNGENLFAYQIWMRSQSTVEIILPPVWEYGRSPYWNSISCFNFDLCVVIGTACDFASACQILSQSDDRWRSYDVISIFQDGGHRVRKLLPCSLLVIAFVGEGKNLFACQISMRYLNSRSEIKLIPASEKGLPPYWNFTSDFDIDLCLLLGM